MITRQRGDAIRLHGVHLGGVKLYASRPQLDTAASTPLDPAALMDA